jgi:ribosomal small subunit protein bTHX
MGKGDRRTKRGKIFKQSYGKHRPAKKDHVAYVPKPAMNEEKIEKVIISKPEAAPVIKEKKIAAVKAEKKEAPEKKAKVLKIEELSPEILAETKVEKTEKKAAAEKKPAAEKKAATPKKEAAPKGTKAATVKEPKPKATATKEKSADKKTKS